LPPLADNNPALQLSSEVAGWGSNAVAEQVDFQQEADGCFRLAESETHTELRTILMGMGYGWLTLARHHKASRDRNPEPFEEPADEPDDLL
jgi:hypothetical protein